MNEPRANASTLMPPTQNFLYAFGGYNNTHNSSTVVDSMERLNLSNIHKKNSKWEMVKLTMKTHVKACNYMYYISD